MSAILLSNVGVKPK